MSQIASHKKKPLILESAAFFGRGGGICYSLFVTGYWVARLTNGCVSFELRLTPPQPLPIKGGAFAPPLLMERGLGGEVSFGKPSIAIFGMIQTIFTILDEGLGTRDLRLQASQVPCPQSKKEP